MSNLPKEVRRSVVELVDVDSAIRKCERIVTIDELVESGRRHFRMVKRSALLHQILDVVAVFIERRRASIEEELASIVEQREAEAVDVTRRRVLGSLLELVDLIDTVQESVEDDALKVPMRALDRRIDRLFKTHGFVRIETIGRIFDVDDHEVIDEDSSEERQGTILREVARGYRSKDTILRVASVVISTGSA